VIDWDVAVVEWLRAQEARSNAVAVSDRIAISKRREQLVRDEHERRIGAAK
jgi:hypothetical protein